VTMFLSRNLQTFQVQ